jgi:iron complex transport system ATP-binding protein
MTAEDNAVVDDAMDIMGISSFAGRKLSTLSDGERQKCMIAKALAQETSLILLDEPTAFLDFGSKINLFRTLKKLTREKQKAILVSTHDIELAIKFADRLWLLSDGVLNEGSIENLSDSGNMQRFLDCDGVVYDKAKNRIEITNI